MIKTQTSKLISFLEVLPLFFLFLTPLTFSACASHDTPAPHQSASDEDKKKEVSDNSVSDSPAETSSGRLEQGAENESSSSQSHNSDAFSVSRFEKYKQYGYCSVFDGVNLSANEVTHCLVCMDSTVLGREKTRLSFHFKRNAEILSFYRGQPYSSPPIYTDRILRRQKIDVTELLWPVFADIEAAPSHLDTSLGPESWGRNVTIQVDQGDVRAGTWAKSLTNVVFTPEKAIVRELKDEMAKGKHVVIKVGKDSEGTLPLDGFADAVADYKIRVTQSKELWKE